MGGVMAHRYDHLREKAIRFGTRNFWSVHEVLTIRITDPYLGARVQAWIDYIESQW